MTELRDQGVDVEVIMDRIRRRAEEADGPSAPERPVPPRADVAPGFSAARHHLGQVNVLHDPVPTPEIVSRGGRTARWMKRAVGRAFEPYHRAVLFRQAQFNGHVANLLNALLPAIEQRIEREAAARREAEESIRGAVTGIDARAGEWERRVGELASLLREVEARSGETARTVDETRERLASHAEASASLERELEALRSDLAASGSRLYEELEELRAVGRRVKDFEQDLLLQKRRLELILRELRAHLPEQPGALARVADQEERLSDHSYFLFEERFRGSQEEVRRRQAVYLPLFTRLRSDPPGEDLTSPVLDVGCGRGEFLAALGERGIRARGIDINEDMVQACRNQGLDVERAEALAHLAGLPDDCLGGLMCCQVLEHLPVRAIVELLKLAYQKLRRGAPAVFETPNPTSLIVAATQFRIDLSHTNPIHPLALSFLAESVGFSDVRVEFLSPFGPHEQLQRLEPATAPESVWDQNVERLNSILFGFQDYAVVVEK